MLSCSYTWKLPSPMQAMTRLSFAAWAYPRVAPTDHPIEPYCIWNSYLPPNICNQLTILICWSNYSKENMHDSGLSFTRSPPVV